MIKSLPIKSEVFMEFPGAAPCGQALRVTLVKLPFEASLSEMCMISGTLHPPVSSHPFVCDFFICKLRKVTVTLNILLRLNNVYSPNILLAL